MLNKSNYLKGENISFSSNYDIPFQEESKHLIIENIKTGDIDSLLYVNQSIFLNNDGDYKIYFSYIGTNGKVINSNIETFSVNDYSIELSKISQNKDLLNAFSENLMESMLMLVILTMIFSLLLIFFLIRKNIIISIRL